MADTTTTAPRYNMAVGEWKRRIWRWANTAPRHRTLIGLFAEHASMADLTAYPSIATLMAGYEKRWRSMHPGNQYSSPSYRTFQRWLGEVRHYGAYTIVEQRRGKKDNRDNLQPQWYTVNVVQFDFNLDLAKGGFHDFLAPWPEPGVASVAGLSVSSEVSSEVSPQVSSEVSSITDISNKSFKKSMNEYVNTSVSDAGRDPNPGQAQSSRHELPARNQSTSGPSPQIGSRQNNTGVLVDHFNTRQVQQTGIPTTENQLGKIGQAFTRLLNGGTSPELLSKSIDRYWDQRWNKTVYAPGSHYLAFSLSDIALISQQESVSDDRPDEWTLAYSSAGTKTDTMDSWSLDY